MWFVFPQLAGLGRSDLATYYGIESIEEARAYVAHPVLGPRLLEAIEALIHGVEATGIAPACGVEQVLGTVDTLKMRSCLTLFEVASQGNADAPKGLDRLIWRALDDLFLGQRDEVTLAMLSI